MDFESFPNGEMEAMEVMEIIFDKTFYFYYTKIHKEFPQRFTKFNGKHLGVTSCFLRESLRNPSANLNYFQCFFDHFIHFLQLFIRDDVRWQNVNNISNWTQNHTIFDEEIIEFVA